MSEGSLSPIKIINHLASKHNTADLVSVLMSLRNVYLSRHHEEGSFDLSARAWETMLHIAGAYGWEPLGTICHEMDGWGGSYLSNDCQTVTCEDAANLAAALSKGVADDFQKLNGTQMRRGRQTLLEA